MWYEVVFFCRYGDGWVVLRLLVREFFVSEVMFYLGVFISWVVVIVVSNDFVWRD